MLAEALGWIPFFGPIIQGAVGIFTSFFSKETAVVQANAQIDTQVIQSSTQITLAAMQLIPVRIARDMIMFPGSAWCGLYTWDKIVAHHYPELVFDVAPLDGPMAVLPMALLTFFFGVTALGIFRK